MRGKLRVTMLAFLLGACSSNGPSIPEEPPYITGTITAVGLGSVRIEEVPADSSGSAKAQARTDAGTIVIDRSRNRLTFDSLRVGQRVSAWFTGPIMESYPVQGNARVIVVEPVNGT